MAIQADTKQAKRNTKNEHFLILFERAEKARQKIYNFKWPFSHATEKGSLAIYLLTEILVFQRTILRNFSTNESLENAPNQCCLNV